MSRFSPMAFVHEIGTRARLDRRRSACGMMGLAVESLEGRAVPSSMAVPRLDHTIASAIGPRTAGSADVHGSQTDGFVSMFDGKSLDGWFNPFRWGRAVARKGEIQLSSDTKFFLVNKTPHKDFILELDALIPYKGNSGIQIRSRYWNNGLSGYQVDIDNNQSRNWAGWLYNEGKGWVVPPRGRAAVKPGQWNHYRVEAIGGHLRVLVNNKVTVDSGNLADNTGYIALQNHGSSGVYRFKNIRIVDLGG